MSAAAIRYQGGASASPALPLDVLLSSIASLPRPILSRLTARMIDRMDELDGDPDLEPEQDQCEAGDDGCGPIYRHGAIHWGAAQDGEGEQ